MAKYIEREWRSPEFGGCCPTALDWAQMAAYIDGEGSVLINTQKRGGPEARGFYLRVTVANTDVRLMHWLQERFGGTFKDSNSEKYYAGKNWKRAYHWGASARRGAWILYNCTPYFVLKGEQAAIGMQMQESLDSNKFRGARNPVSQEVHTHRKGLKQQLLSLKTRGIKPVSTSPDFDMANAS